MIYSPWWIWGYWTSFCLLEWSQRYRETNYWTLRKLWHWLEYEELEGPNSLSLCNPVLEKKHRYNDISNGEEVQHQYDSYWSSAASLARWNEKFGNCRPRNWLSTCFLQTRKFIWKVLWLNTPSPISTLHYFEKMCSVQLYIYLIKLLKAERF